uniref:BZIP domain-containing protein n=1 Tax=Anopheles dirus TaxID=7168 RepID=A0A182N5W4_9DIPT
MMDLKTESRLSPSLYSPASPKMADAHGRPQSTDSGVLDLSKRRDSLDARKTPSPSTYHCFSDVAGTPPPSNHSSPQCEPVAGDETENTILLNYGELVRARRLSPTKSLLHFDELNAHPMALQAFHRHGMGLCKPEPTTDILQQHLLQQTHHRAGPIPSYLLPAAALQQHHLHQQQQQHQHQQQQHQQHKQQTSPAAFSPSPIRLRELDTMSESGSEGTSRVTSSQRSKPKEDAGCDGPAQPSQGHQYPMVVGRDGKLSRPFKAYPRDPLSLAAGFVASDTILDTHSAEKYNLFRKRMLEQIHAANGGQPTVSNPKMRRLASSKSGTGSSSNAPSVAMSDASSESCDEKPPSHEATRDSMMVRPTTDRSPLPRTPSKPPMVPAAADSDSDSVVTAPRNGADGGTASGQPNGPTPAGVTKDSAYYERRKKNNAAAKKSRDRRRIKEDEIAIRAAFLERENIELKFELAAARKQLALYGVTSSSAAATTASVAAS